MYWDDSCRSSCLSASGDDWGPREAESEGEGLLSGQEKKFTRDWGVLSRIFPGRKMEEYRYGWLLVNTRSLYCGGLGGERNLG